MLGLVLIILVLGVTLAVLLWVGTVWFQGYIYSEPVEQAYWRGPAAAAVITLFIAFWCWLNYRSPGQFPGQFQFTSGDDYQVKRLWAVRQGNETLYELTKNARGMAEYVNRPSNRPWQQHPDAIIVEEPTGDKVQFDAERDANGKFKVSSNKSLVYRDERGRTMAEDRLGQLTVPRRGLLFANLLLNLVHLGVWFAALWLVLRFQWSHALGLAVVFWLLMTLTILHMVLLRTEEVGRQRASAAVVSA